MYIYRLTQILDIHISFDNDNFTTGKQEDKHKESKYLNISVHVYID